MNGSDSRRHSKISASLLGDHHRHRFLEDRTFTTMAETAQAMADVIHSRPKDIDSTTQGPCVIHKPCMAQKISGTQHIPIAIAGEHGITSIQKQQQQLLQQQQQQSLPSCPRDIDRASNCSNDTTIPPQRNHVQSSNDHLLVHLQFIQILIAQLQRPASSDQDAHKCQEHYNEIFNLLQRQMIHLIDDVVSYGKDAAVTDANNNNNKACRLQEGEDDDDDDDDDDAESTAESYMMDDFDEDDSCDNNNNKNKSLMFTDPCILIKVFHSAPLTYCDTQGQIHPIPLLDIEFERNALVTAVRAETSSTTRPRNIVQFEFDVATLSRISDFFDRGNCEILHLSCFGSNDYLALENGFGGMDILPLHALQSIMKTTSATTTRTPFQAVFISTSCPRAAGEAFVAAGVPHVICCDHRHTHQDHLAMKFAETFYSALAKGATIKWAFQMAKQSVQCELYSTTSPCATIEGEYYLLPEKSLEDAYHDVCITLPSKPRHLFPFKLRRPTLQLLPTTTSCPGRKKTLDMFSLLGLVSKVNLVQLQDLAGARHLAALVAKYVRLRQSSMGIDDVIWLPPTIESDLMRVNFGRIFDLLLLGDSSLTVPKLMGKQSRYSTFFMEATSYLVGKRCLIVVNGKQFISDVQQSRLTRFIADLLNETNIKIIHV